MAGEIGKAGLILTVNGVEFEAKLKSAGEKVTDFKKKVDKASLRDYAEGVGRVREAFASLNNLDLSNPISALQNLKSHLELVVMSARSARVALISLGVGAALAIGGSILSSMMGGEGGGGGAGGGGAGGEGAGRADPFSRGRARAGVPGWMPSWVPFREESSRRAAEEEIARDHAAAIAVRHADEASRIRAMRGPMLDRAAMAGMDPSMGDPRIMLETGRAAERARTIESSGSADTVLARGAAARSIRREIVETLGTMRLSDSATRTADFTTAARRMREETATMGMGPEAAALAGLDRADTERVERHAARVRELNEALSRGAITGDEHTRMLRESASALSREEAAARGAHEAIRERGRAAMAESLRSPLELAARRAGEMRALGADASMTDRAIGSMLAGLTAGGPGSNVGLNAPTALMMGSVAAITEANRIARETAAAAEDPVDRTIRVLETMRTVEEETRREMEAIGRALRDGRIVLPAGRR